MKKALSMNLSGIVFHIDEDAFEKLGKYLEAIKLHFRGFDGRDEVIADIESRIAEILQNKIHETKQVITIEDIDEVIGIMGQPADYILDEKEESIAGSRADAFQSKRLYRDPDKRIIGGVCSGIASYFIIDPLWIRLIFIIMAFSGFGVMLYLILWIVVPEARTTAEKLEMRGQQVNISNIEQSLKDEVDHLKNKLNDLTHKAKGSYRKTRESFNQSQRDQVRSGLHTAGRIIARVILIFIGFIIFIIGLALSLAFLAIVFKFPVLSVADHAEFGGVPLYPALSMIFSTDSDLRIFTTALFVVLGIPLLIMLWEGIRLIFNLPPVRYLGRISALAWIIALVFVFAFGIKTYNSFRYQREFTREEILPTGNIDTIRLVTPFHLPVNLDWSHSGYYYFPEWRLALTENENVLFGIPRLRIYASSDSLSRLVTVASARGSFQDDAEEIARRIQYDWKLSGDTLRLPDSFILHEGENWRKQELELKLYMPEGTIFKVDEHSERILRGNSKYARTDLAGKTCIMEGKGIKILIRQ